MFRILFSIYVWLIVLCITIFMTPFFLLVWLTTSLFDKQLLILHHLSNFWGSLFTWLVPGWNVKIIGKEKLDNKPKVIIANHQSQEDILLIYRLGVPFRWISKAEVFKTPIYGWFMHLKGDIKLLRSSRSSIRKMIKDAEKVINKGCVITIFPEGTRSKTGKLGNFKEGAFKLAMDTRVPIQPVVIYGTGQKLIYKYGIFKGRHTSIMKILDPINFNDYQNMEIKDLANMSRELIENELEILKNESR